MALAHFQRTFTDASGNVKPGLSVTVRRESDNGLAALFADAGSVTPKSNPFNTDANGHGSFYVVDGRYRIQATDIDWRNEDLVSQPDLAASIATNTAAILDRVIRVTSISAMAAYSAPVGYVFSLNDGGRSGVFDVVAGDFSTELAADTFNGIYIGQADDPTATTKVAKRRIETPYSPLWFGADPSIGVYNTDEFNSMASVAGEGASVIIPEGVFLYSSKISTLANQTWRFEGSLKLDDQGVDFDGGSFAVKSGVVLINPKIDEDYLNNGVSGQGTKYTLSMYSSKNVNVYGGTLSNARHNFLQYGDNSQNINFFGTVFHECGEHCLYGSAASTPVGDPDASTSKNIKFVSCVLLSPGQGATQTSAHFTKHRGMTSVAFIGCKFGGKLSSIPRSITESENSSNISFSNCHAEEINHNAINTDETSFNIFWDGGIIDKRVTNGLSSSFVESANPNGKTVISNAIIYNGSPSPVTHKTEIINCEVTLPAGRYNITEPITFINTTISVTASSSTDYPIKVSGTSGLLRLRNSTIKTNGTAFLVGLSSEDGGSLDIDGLDMSDWAGVTGRAVYAKGTAGDLQILKGIVFSDSTTSTSVIRADNFAGDIIVGECVARNGSALIDAGLTSVLYGNLFS